MCDKLIKLSSPKVSASRIGITYMRIEQMILLKKMDSKRLKEKTPDNSDFWTHKYKHCKTMLSFPWKINGKLKSKHTDELGAYHAAHAAMHLEKCCDEAVRTSIEQRMIEKITIN